MPFSEGRSLAGRLSKVGGTLVLTGDAVMFKPVGGLGQARSFPLTDIHEVSAYADRPPRLRVSTRDGRALVLMVLASRAASMWSKDTSARDDAVAKINARLQAG